MGDELDTDWTLSTDWVVEQELRDKRNILIHTQLNKGKIVVFRSSGSSLWPRVRSNDLCFYAPVIFEEQIALDDIIFCKPQPKGYYYAHVVSVKEWDYQNYCWAYWISNLKGHYNGWCHKKHIFGRLFEVSR